MKISKKIIKKVNQLAILSDKVHDLNIELKDYFKNKGILENSIQDELSSLCYGDISGEEFIESMLSILEEVK